MEYREFEYEDDSGLIDDKEDFQVGFQQAQQMQKAFGGVLLGANIAGDDKLAKIAKRVSKLSRTDEEVFVKKAVRAINTIKAKNCFKIEFNDVDEIIQKCQKIPDFKYKSTLGIIVAGKYYSANEDTRKKILNCLDELKITLFDIVKYIRLLQHYKIIR